jgi:hypothetical protein
MSSPPASLGVTLATCLLIAAPAQAGGCPADLNGDGVVNIADLLVLLQSLGPCPGCVADINGDDSVGSSDLAILLANWGPCPPAVVPGDEERFTETIAVEVTPPEAAELGLTVTHLYATGPEVVVGDILLQADGAQIATSGATLYQHSFGDDVPPNAKLLLVFPELAFDTFVTMHAVTADNNLVEFSDMDHESIEGWWFLIPEASREAVDISDVTGNPGQSGVLIAQITLRCAGDVNLDGTVGTADLLDMLSAWGESGPADFDNDQTVATGDLLILLSGWGECAVGYSGTVRLYTGPEDGGTLLGIEVPVQFQ